MSLTSQRRFKLRLPETPPSRHDDWSWTLRATYQCGKVQHYAFGENSSLAPSVYSNLMLEVEDWRTERPVGFDPVFQDAGNENGFPNILLQMDCHGKACRIPL
jgi:hypothetical protein